MAKCPKHPKVTLRCPACQGAKGGRSTSEVKAQAARRNARLNALIERVNKNFKPASK